MKESERISHDARVTQVSANSASIQLVKAEACHTCSAQGVCGVSETDKKTFAVPNDTYSIGQAVRVEISTSTAARALITAYMIPFLLVFIVLIVLIASGMKEGVSGLLSLAVLPIYYLITKNWLSSHIAPFELNVRKL